MKIRPIYPLLAAFLVTLAACDGGASGGGDTGGGGTTGEGGAGGTGGTGGTGGAGGGGNVCATRASMVFGCVVPEGLTPDAPASPVSLVTTGTVTAVRDPDPATPCPVGYAYWYQVGRAAPTVTIDLVDASGATLTVAVAAPGFTTDDVTVGDTLDVDFASESVDWGGRIGHLRIERGGQLVAAVGENDPIGLTIGQDQSECYRESGLCGYEEFAATVAAPDGSSATIPSGETADVGELSITNDRYFRNYDSSGGCNFGLSVEYLIGVTPAP